MRRTAEHARLRPSVTSGRARGGLVTARGLMRSTLTIVALSGLIGCTGTPEPDPTPAPGINTPSASPSAEPTESEPADTEVEKPERPAAMDREDVEGAAAAAEYFIELYPYVMATGDTEEYEAMSHEACGFCDGVIADATNIHENHRTYTGGITHATIEERYRRDDLTGAWPLDINVRQEKATVLDSEGQELADTAAHEGLVRVEIGLKDNQWVVVGVIEKDES